METATQYETEPQMDELADESNDHAYFAMLSNMLDDLLDPYQYRLYAHIKRVCGEAKDKRCWQSTVTMAEQCKMSTGKVAECKRDLEQLGLITITECKRPHGGLPYHRIAIVDIWARNIEHCTRTRSPGEQASSYSEQASSLGETKKTPPKEDPTEETEQESATPSVPDTPPLTLNAWLETIKTSKNRPAILRWMLSVHFPDNELPDYGKIGMVAKRLHAGRLAQLIWENSGRRITGCPLDYIQMVAKGGAKRQSEETPITIGSKAAAALGAI